MPAAPTATGPVTSGEIEAALSRRFTEALDRVHYAATVCERAEQNVAKLGSPRGLALLAIAAAARPERPDAMIRFSSLVSASALAQALVERADAGGGPCIFPSRLAQLALACESAGAKELLRAFRAAQRLGLRSNPVRHARALSRAITALGKAGEARLAVELYAESTRPALAAPGSCASFLAADTHLLTALCIAVVQAADVIVARLATSLVADAIRVPGAGGGMDPLGLQAILAAAALAGDAALAVSALTEHGFGQLPVADGDEPLRAPDGPAPILRSLWQRMPENKQQRALANCLTAIARNSPRRYSEHERDEMAGAAVRVWQRAVALGMKPDIVCLTALANATMYGEQAKGYTEAVIQAAGRHAPSSGGTAAGAERPAGGCEPRGHLRGGRPAGRARRHEQGHRAAGNSRDGAGGEPAVSDRPAGTAGADLLFLNSLLHCFAWHRRADRALDVLREAVAAGRPADQISLTLLLTACARDGKASGPLLAEALRQAAALVVHCDLGAADAQLCGAMRMAYESRLASRAALEPRRGLSAQPAEHGAESAMELWRSLARSLALDADEIVREVDAVRRGPWSDPLETLKW